MRTPQQHLVAIKEAVDMHGAGSSEAHKALSEAVAEITRPIHEGTIREPSTLKAWVERLHPGHPARLEYEAMLKYHDDELARERREEIRKAARALWVHEGAAMRSEACWLNAAEFWDNKPEDA